MADRTKTLVDLDAADEEAQAVATSLPPRGFLPIQTNWFDRLFISIYVGVALELLWMRFLEAAIPLSVCRRGLVIALGVVIIRRG